MSDPNNLNPMVQELTDPITLDLVEDPIVVPCCTKAFSRMSLIQSVAAQYQPKCPACNQVFNNFDPLQAPTNVVIAGMVETLKRQMAGQTRGGIDPTQNAEWKATITPVVIDKDPTTWVSSSPIAELKIYLENSQFKIEPTLFIAVCDTSGSMSGNPWKQVESALIHIMGMTQSNPMIKTSIVRYSSTAEIINTNGSQSEVTHRIRRMFDGMGTNFMVAFEKVKEVLDQYVYASESNQQQSNAVSNVIITFLTDGQVGSTDRLVEVFRESLLEWPGPLTVHSVGFGGGCDKRFLENLRLCGPQEGTFRYAEPQDDPDTLCQKLTGLFDMISKNSTIPVQLNLDDAACFRLKSNPKELVSQIETQFPVMRNQKGKLSNWIQLSDLDCLPKLTIKSSLDDHVEIPISLVTQETDHLYREKQAILSESWMAYLIDNLASELLVLNTNRGTMDPFLFELHACLLEQRIDAVHMKTQKEHSVQRLNFLSQQIKDLKKGLSIHEGKLSDLRFGSQFGQIKSKNTTTTDNGNNNISVNPVKRIESEPDYVKEYGVRYSKNNDGKNRNQLQELIMDSINTLTPRMTSAISSLTPDQMSHLDNDGNNALHLACYSGLSYFVDRMLQHLPSDLVENLVNLPNNDGETPTTLAIKKMGYWKTLKHLLKAGGYVPQERLRGLEEYAVNQGYVVTAKLLGNLDGQNDAQLIKNVKSVNHQMKPDYIEFLYDAAKEKGIEIDLQKYLEVCSGKLMIKMVKELIHQRGAVATSDILFKHGFPPKPDHVETDKYLVLAKTLVKSNRKLLTVTNQDGDTPLFKSAERGSLKHLQYFLREHPENLEQQNAEGNTPLHIAAYKQYPCIIEELIDHGANVNHRNQKGNIPMMSSCQYGPIKIMETLLAAGSDYRNINSNGDTLILLCCRNGQEEKLRLLLNYVDSDFVDFKAHIDGFNAMFASVEANKPKCVKVLHEYGVQIEQRTDDDNQILPGATPLHLAAYYGCKDAMQELLNLGADPNVLDSINGMTPLHLAVMQKQPLIIKMLLNNGANPGIKDKSGCFAVTYCRDDHELRDILINPALDVLIKLAKGMSHQIELQACEIIRKYSGEIGCLSPHKALDLVAADGSTPLQNSVINSTDLILEILLKMGCNPDSTDRYGLNAHIWARIINNQKVKKLLEGKDSTPEKTQEALAQIQKSIKESPQNARILFLGNSNQNVSLQMSSGLPSRMQDFLNMVTIHENNNQDKVEYSEQTQKKSDLSIDNVIDQDHKKENKQKGQMIVRAFSQQKDLNQEAYQVLLRRAKLVTVGLIASGNTVLTPTQILALCLYTNNPLISKKVNESICHFYNGQSVDQIISYKPYLETLYSVWDDLLPYQGEVFIGAEPTMVNRNLFLLDNVVSFRCFVSGSTSWRIATEHVTKFAEKKHEGTVFLIKSKTGRFVSQHSEYVFDMEVLFRPDTNFKVTAWYRGTPICLAQANIREHTFGLLEEEDRAPYYTNKKNLVIELTEI